MLLIGEHRRLIIKIIKDQLAIQKGCEAGKVKIEVR